jgi:hypothetical protein
VWVVVGVGEVKWTTEDCSGVAGPSENRLMYTRFSSNYPPYVANPPSFSLSTSSSTLDTCAGN